MRLLLLWLMGYAAANGWRSQAMYQQARLAGVAEHADGLGIQMAGAAGWACVFVALIAWLLLRRGARIARVTIVAMLLYHAHMWLDAALLSRSEAALATLGFRALLSLAALAITVLLAWRAGREAARAGATRPLTSP